MSKSVTFCIPASDAPHHLPRSSFVPPKSTWPVRASLAPTTSSPAHSSSSGTAAAITASPQARTTSVSVLPSKGTYPQTVVVSLSPVLSPSPQAPLSPSQSMQGSSLIRASIPSSGGEGDYTSAAHSTDSSCPGSKSRVEPMANNIFNLSKVSKVTEQMRKQTNSASHDLVRTAKYEVSRMREFVLKVEEETKLTNKARHTLEMAVQDIRKSISVNQQTISSQQKKTRGGEVSPRHIDCKISRFRMQLLEKTILQSSRIVSCKIELLHRKKLACQDCFLVTTKGVYALVTTE